MSEGYGRLVSMDNNKHTDRPEGLPAHEPVFVPKRENVVSLSRDECIERIRLAQNERNKINKEIEKLKKLSKDFHTESDDTDYTTPNGTRDYYQEVQQTVYDKEMILRECPDAMSTKKVRRHVIK